ncbi:MAG TPA: carboxypeptidase-like regulatory domain-containing protein, partial [Bryobacterales bacterium]|nr:carboxypeptidase-like regulatory domain-containing protein [Bryobacterales bacterium]
MLKATLALLLVVCAARGEMLRGVVRSPAGQPVAKARVGASPFEHNLDTVFAVTNTAGEYSFDLPAGDYVVYVDASGYEMAIEAAKPGAGSLDFRLETVTPPALPENYIASAKTTEGPLLDAQYREMEAYFDRLIAEAEAKRESKWKRDFSSLDRYLASVEPHRKKFIELLGGFPAQKTPLHPRRELLGETDTYRTER